MNADVTLLRDAEDATYCDDDEAMEFLYAATESRMTPFDTPDYFAAEIPDTLDAITNEAPAIVTMNNLRSYLDATLYEVAVENRRRIRRNHPEWCACTIELDAALYTLRHMTIPEFDF